MFNFIKNQELEIKEDMISNELIKDLELRDKVVVINFNEVWIVIPLKHLAYFPVLYFKNKDIIATLIICLVTLRTMFVYDKYNISHYDDYQIKLADNSSSKKIKDFDDINDGVKKSQAKIQSLRSALIEYGDVKYLHLGKNIKEVKPMVDINYFTNLTDKDDKIINEIQFHPKTLYTVIRYSSKNKLKITLVVPEGANVSEPYGYEPKKALIDQYLAQMSAKLIEKKAFIYHIYAYTARIIYENAKVITL